MGNDENWVRSLRAAGHEYEMTPPVGLWEGIEAELHAAVAGSPNWFVRHGRAMWSAAACMAFAAVAAIYIICGIGGKDGEAPLVAEETGRDEIEDNFEVLNGGDSAPIQVLQEIGKTEGSLIAVDERVDANAPKYGIQDHGYAEFSYYERIIVSGEGSDAPHDGSVKVSAVTDVKVSGDTTSGTVLKKPGKGLGGALYAKAALPKSPYGMPVGAGATVEIPLSGRLNLETGVEYTGFKSPGSTENYIGVPVKVNYDVYDNGQVRLYASGGGAVEKSLSTRDLQLSVAAGVGAEFSLSDDWGIFIEPSVDYYPGNGNGVPTLYKDRKISPEVKVGLRHTFRQ